MNNSLNFDDATTGGNGRKYLEPGVHTVRTKEILSGVASTGAPYIEWVVEDKSGLTCAHRYYLNTTVAEGKQMSSWDITKNIILGIVKNALGVDEATAKTKMPRFDSVEQMYSKLAPELTKIVLGKNFDILLTGEEIEGKEGKNNWTKSDFGKGRFTAPAGSNQLRFDPSKHIKKLPTNMENTNTNGIHTHNQPTW